MAVASGGGGGGGGGVSGHRRQESMYAMTGLYSETTDTEDCNNTDTDTAGTSHNAPCYDSVVKCHSRNPSSGLVDKYVPCLILILESLI